MKGLFSGQEPSKDNSGRAWKSLFYYCFISFLLTGLLISFAALPAAAEENTPSESRAISRADTIGFTIDLVFDEPLEEGALVLYPGDYYHFYLSVTNTGTLNDSFDLSLTGVPSGWEIHFPNKLTSITIDLEANGTGNNHQDVLVVVSIPETAKKDDSANLDFSATSAESVKASSEITKTLDLLILVNYMPPYILLETAEAEQELEPGGTPASFNIAVRNLGYETVEYYPPGTDGFTLPDDWTISIPMADTPIVLDPAASDSFEVTIGAADNALAGEKVRIKIEGYSTSLDSTILPLELIVQVKQIHNLVLNAPSALTVLSPLKEVSYQVSVKNSGNGPETINLRLVSPAATSSWNALLEAESIILPAGAHRSVKVNFTPALDATKDSFDFVFNADIMDSATVLQTETFTTSVEVNYVPDLSIDETDIQMPGINLEPDQSYPINITVHNNGIVQARNVTVHFELITQTGSQKQIGSVVIDVIPAGGQAGASIEWNVDPATSYISVSVDPDNATMEVDELNNIALQSVFIIQPEVRPSDGGGGSGGIAGIGTIGSVVVLTALISITSVMALVTLNSEAGRYGMLTFFMPLYSKMRREDLLLHETREMVYDYVKTHPGEHFRSIMNKLSLTNGTLAHHLYTLEKREFIKSERDGPYKRFYPSGYSFDGSVMEVNGLQKKILDVIDDNPGISQKGLAKALAVSAPTINYHIKTMVGARLVELQRSGKETRCYRIKAE
jgi:predicted transcriptional regulator/uncharacterized membrane protein